MLLSAAGAATAVVGAVIAVPYLQPAPDPADVTTAVIVEAPAPEVARPPAVDVAELAAPPAVVVPKPLTMPSDVVELPSAGRFDDAFAPLPEAEGAATIEQLIEGEGITTEQDNAAAPPADDLPDDAEVLEGGEEVVVAPPLPHLRPQSEPVPAMPVTDDLARKIGQLIVVGFRGKSTSNEWVQTLLTQIADGYVGGVMFTKRNVTNRDSVLALSDAFQNAAGGTPLFVAVDQEGGAIERLTGAAGFRERPSARDLAASQSPDEARQTYAAMASDLKSWGFNLNFGPVLDLDVNPTNPIIGKYGRAFSADATKVTAYGQAFIDGHHASNVLTSAKHFPGHGSSLGDTHDGFVDVSATWSEAELEPYRQLIANGSLDMVMSSHIYLAQMASADERLPVSLSPTALGRLRNELGFDGVVVTDDMEMGAIAEVLNIEDAIIAAIEAGNDLVIYSNYQKPDLDLPPRIVAKMRERALVDDAFRARIESAYRRIMELKRSLALAPSAEIQTRSLAARKSADAAVRLAQTTTAGGFRVPNLEGLHAFAPNKKEPVGFK